MGSTDRLAYRVARRSDDRPPDPVRPSPAPGPHRPRNPSDPGRAGRSACCTCPTPVDLGRGAMRSRGGRGLAAAALIVVSAGCGGSPAGGGADAGTADVGIELSYVGGPSPRAEGVARTLASSAPPGSVVDRPADTWLRITVAGPGFEPIVCQLPR